jgi:hypothetical protein
MASSWGSPDLDVMVEAIETVIHRIDGQHHRFVRARNRALARNRNAKGTDYDYAHEQKQENHPPKGS